MDVKMLDAIGFIGGVTAIAGGLLGGAEFLIQATESAYDKKVQRQIEVSKIKARRAKREYEKQIWEERKSRLHEKNMEEWRKLIQAEIDKQIKRGA